ncbi:diatom spindle kinesin-1 [Penicillium alfredii]|uniref:Diatom spindle kinesin-1 n=1 Tax=Penicillium alfredii TaxID=1506179 RepID=A0A9W9JWX1_9EURO|nr:diatom spindle kinesin-1 [Penicillium alfredii]KAJ5084062.1 diatom spindle kinesin-1 [Penicillium alfredii]
MILLRARHAVCRIRIEHPSADILEDGFLYLIDLAGSEAARDIAAHTSNRMKETREINVSLSTLKDCIRGMAAMDLSSGKTSKRPYIPFQHSMLTKVLKHLFDPTGHRNCRTAVIACINPSLSEQSLAVVLCPQMAVGDHVKHVFGNTVSQTEAQEGGQNPSETTASRYLCALILSGTLAGAFEVHLWRQVVIDVKQMEAEVLLEYDAATRYCYATM